MTGAPTPPPNDSQVVEVEGGPVTLASVDQLVARRDSLSAQARDLEAQATQLEQDATSKAREAATYLVAQRARWDTKGAAEQLAHIDSLTARIDLVDTQLAALDLVNRRGFGGFFKRFGDHNRRAGLITERDQAAAEVSSTLAEIGTHAPTATFAEAETLLGPARQEANQADALRQQRNVTIASIAPLDEEVARRQEAIKKLGFDALWTAAWLRDHEPPTIDSPVTLKKGETAWLSVNAVLSRQATRTRWTGSSQGVSFPIGHTGIRYRVGGYTGHPIQTTYIRDLDTGSLVVTNQRLIFIGRLKSVTAPISRIVHVETYTDALAVFQNNRETPDFFKLQTPQYVLFYINYAISRLA